MFRRRKDVLEVFLVHHGGPYFEDKDEGFWSIPKGHVKKDEDLLETAKREFEEETGIKPKGKFFSLGKISCNHGKILHVWAFENDWKGILKENIIEIEFPAHSGKKIKIPEVDKVEYFNAAEAKIKIDSCQIGFMRRLQIVLGYRNLIGVKNKAMKNFKNGLSFVFKNRNLNSSR